MEVTLRTFNSIVTIVSDLKRESTTCEKLNFPSDEIHQRLFMAHDNNSKVVKVKTMISIPYSLLAMHDEINDTFLYENETSYNIITKEDLNRTFLSECALMHYGRISPIIQSELKQLCFSKEIPFLQIPCLSTLILLSESV